MLKDPATTALLDRISDPSDLRKLPEAQLLQLADELRQETIRVVSITGGHLGASLELLHPDREMLGPAFRVLASLPRLTRLLASRPQRPAEGARLPPELDRAFDDLPPDRRVRGSPARVLLTARARLPACRAPRPGDLFAFAGLDRSDVQEAVPTVDRLEPASGEQRSDRSRRRERLHDADLLAELGRRQVDELAGRRSSGHGGKEGVGPLEAFLVHAGHRVRFGVGAPPDKE